MTHGVRFVSLTLAQRTMSVIERAERDEMTYSSALGMVTGVPVTIPVDTRRR